MADLHGRGIRSPGQARPTQHHRRARPRGRRVPVLAFGTRARLGVCRVFDSGGHRDQRLAPLHQSKRIGVRGNSDRVDSPIRLRLIDSGIGTADTAFSKPTRPRPALREARRQPSPLHRYVALPRARRSPGGVGQLVKEPQHHLRPPSSSSEPAIVWFRPRRRPQAASGSGTVRSEIHDRARRKRGSTHDSTIRAAQSVRQPQSSTPAATRPPLPDVWRGRQRPRRRTGLWRDRARGSATAAKPVLRRLRYAIDLSWLMCARPR